MVKNKFLLWTLRWAPRLLAIIFILFISLFAFDVFSEGLGVLETLTALGMHLIPSILLVIALCISWRWSWAGFLFFFLGTFFLVQSRESSWFTLVIISGVPMLIGCLFMAGWWYQVKPQTGL